MQLTPYLDIFNPKAELHAGLSLDGDVYRYVLVSRRNGTAPKIILKKSGSVATMRIPFDGPVHADMGSAPVLLVRETIGDMDPEQWVDKNESRIIPTGVSSAEIENEWAVHDGTLYSGTISKKVHENVLSHLNTGKLLLASLSVPLWDLAMLYMDAFSNSTASGKDAKGLTTFIIWKLFKDSSVLGLVEQGRLWKLCNFWAGIDDVQNNAEKTAKDLSALVKALSQDTAQIPIVVRAADSVLDTSKVASVSGCAFVNAPEMPGVSQEYHEAFALACHQNTQLDFAPYDHVHDSGSLVAMRRKVLKLAVGFCLVLAVVVAGLAVVKGGAVATGWYLGKKAGPSRQYMQQYKMETGRLALLQQTLVQKNKFINQGSLLTYPITEFQTAFPEDSWAGDITFSEAASGSWNCAITAFAYSSSQIPVLLKNLAAVPGMSNVRMLYSEQTAAGRGRAGEKAIKLQIECMWKGK
jgi:hypothetical protein